MPCPTAQTTVRIRPGTPFSPAVRLVGRVGHDGAAGRLGRRRQPVRVDVEQPHLLAPNPRRLAGLQLAVPRMRQGAVGGAASGGAAEHEGGELVVDVAHGRAEESAVERQRPRGDSSRASRLAQKPGSERPYSGGEGKASSAMPQVLSLIIPLSKRERRAWADGAARGRGRVALGGGAGRLVIVCSRHGGRQPPQDWKLWGLPWWFWLVLVVPEASCLIPLACRGRGADRADRPSARRRRWRCSA